jgi:flavin-dependent dehydrogenase
MSKNYDVAIIGGGPGGSTLASLLKKYSPTLSVGVFEREQFPREHVGESHLPPIGAILDEMGVYEKVEAAGFPIKIGATYRWGNSEKLWDFEFMPLADYKDESRPRTYQGQAKRIAFQVERSIYDEILLNHAKELGAEIHMPSQVRQIERESDRVTGLILDDGTRIEAKYYVDASGASALLRRQMGVEVDVPTKLQNVAFWDYWENAEWATRFGGSATRVLVLSIGAGWLWYIPLGPTRTSIGFVCPATYSKSSGKTPKELYDWAVSQEPLLAELTKNATRDNEVRSTKDWSFVAGRMYGENWFLVGETAGFADPILAAGLTLTHTGARELAFTIIALEEGTLDAQWLKHHYAQNQENRVRQHIRFADFWYSANGIFTDLQEYTREIAKDAGLELDAQLAFQWLGTGGFTHDNLGQVGVGGLDLAASRQVAQRFFDADYDWLARKYNKYSLNLDNAEKIFIPDYLNGKVNKVECYVRDKQRLPLTGLFKEVFEILRQPQTSESFPLALQAKLAKYAKHTPLPFLYSQAVQVFEVMLGDGWVRGKYDPLKPRWSLTFSRDNKHFHDNVETNERIEALSENP